jgi:hypothetical protein
MNRIEELEKELKLLREIEELKNKPKFEVGKWYKLTRDYGILKKDMVFMYVRRQDDDNKYPFVIVNHQMFSEVSDGGKNYLAPNEDQLIEATNEEVQTALIKEAKKRGFKEGVRFQSAWDSVEYIFNKIGTYRDRRPHPSLVAEPLGAIFCKGKWATIIDTPLTINGYEMKQEHDLITFGCARFDKNDLKNLKTQINYFNKEGSHPSKPYRKIKSITLDSDVTITVKELQEIVDKID